MNRCIFILCVCLFLAACSIPDSEKLANSARSDLKAVEGVISDLEENLSENCKVSLKSDLNGVYDRIKTIDGKIESSVNACELEKEVLSNKLKSRTLMIWLLIFIIIFGLFIKVKKSI